MLATTPVLLLFGTGLVPLARDLGWLLRGSFRRSVCGGVWFCSVAVCTFLGGGGWSSWVSEPCWPCWA